MKTNLTLLGLLGGMLASLLSVSCTKVEIDEQYVKVEQIVCSFYGSDNAPMEIKVQSNPAAWTAESDQSWLKTDRSADGSTLTLTADDNASEEERSATVTVYAGEAMEQITITQLARSINLPHYKKHDEFQGLGAMSPSGNYIGGYESKYDDNDYSIITPIIIDTHTGEEFRLGDFDAMSFNITSTHCISDDGLLFVSDGEHGVSLVFDKDGTYFALEEPGYSQVSVSNTGAGGKYWVGYAMKQSEDGVLGGLFVPLVWVDREVHELKMPDKNWRGEDFWAGILLRDISADGSIIYGTTWEGDDGGMVYWTNLDEQGQYVGKDVHKVTTVTDRDGIQLNLVCGMSATAEKYKVSPTGKWIAGIYRIEELAEDQWNVNYTQYAAFYNTETETTTILEDYSDCTGLFATDDGIAFIANGTMALSSGIVYDLNQGTVLGSMSEWIYNTYGIHIPENQIITYLNADKDCIFGNIYDNGKFLSYSIIPPYSE